MDSFYVTEYFTFFGIILIKGHKVDFLCRKKRVCFYC